MSENDKSASRVKCPMCGHWHIRQKAVDDAFRLVDAGVRQATVARATGISRQRLNQLLKARKAVGNATP